MSTRKRAPKGSEPRIGAIDWTDNLVWALLAEMEKKENFRVLFGKKDSSENTSGESKASVHRRIAESILPDMFALDGNTIRDRVKTKIESLTKIYSKHAKRLRATGEGVQDSQGDEGDGGSQGTEQTLRFYIGGEGPCVETPHHARNIWNEIEKEFIFFPTLHRIFASRPNVTPIVLTTALGPQGTKTVWVQPPDNNSTVVSEPNRVFGNDATGLVNAGEDPTPVSPPSQPSIETSKARRGPKPSSASRDTHTPEKTSRPKQKRSLADTMLQIQRQNLSAQKAQNQGKLNIEMRKQITTELAAGIWTVEQAREMLLALDNPPPEKRQKVVREYSPDWSSDFCVTEEEH